MKKTLIYGCSLAFAGAVVTLAARSAQSQYAPAYVELQSTTPGTQQVGSANLSGVMRAGNFAGNGSLITNIGAPNVTTGLLADARLGPNVPLINRLNTFSGVQRFASNVLMTSTIATILFPAVNSGTPKPMMTMFASGENNLDRMVLAHSPNYPNWGLQYQDSPDKFNFISGGNPVFTVDLGNSRVGILNSSPTASLDIVTPTGTRGIQISQAASDADTINSTVGAVTTVWPYSDKTAVRGEGVGFSRPGVIGISKDFVGVYAFAKDPGSYALYTRNLDSGSYAAYLDGKAQVTGNLSVVGTMSKGGGSFKIDHPLDPANKFLYHSFVESPDMMNIYNGTVKTDDRGYASVTMPDWFEALNRDFRYQLTIVDDGTDSDQWVMARVAQKMQGNRFVIRTSVPNVEVSWQVTGIRHDNFANAHRIPVEEEKPKDERGYYLHPTENGQPKEMGIFYGEGSTPRRRDNSKP